MEFIVEAYKLDGTKLVKNKVGDRYEPPFGPPDELQLSILRQLNANRRLEAERIKEVLNKRSN